MSRAIVLAALLLAWPAAAQEVGVMLGSWHSVRSACDDWTDGKGCEAANPGVFWRSPAGWLTGAYRNSVGRASVFGGRVWTLAERGRLRGELAALAATGYPAAPVVPVVSPLVALRVGERARIRAGWLPRLGEVNPTHVVYLSIGWEVKP